MADETPTPEPRADVLPRRGGRQAIPISLIREYTVRARRTLAAMNGTDPVSLDGARVDFQLGSTVNFETIVGDASQPPFRYNGRSVRFQARQAAPGGGNNLFWELGVRFPSTGAGLFYAALVIDSVKYEGVGDCSYGLTTFTNPGTAAANFPVSVEEPPSKPGAANFKVATLVTIADLVQSAGNNIPFVDGTDWTVLGFLGGTPAAGPDVQEAIGDIVVWPGTSFIAQMDTSATAGRLLIRARYWNFGSSLGSGQLPQL